MNQYVALLRGINVGGKNLIKMAELRLCFEGVGLSDVRTYIQSGNVLFRSPEKDMKVLTKKIETALDKAFGYESKVVLRSQQQLRAVVEHAPSGFGTTPRYRYYILFLKEPFLAEEVVQTIPLKEGVDQAWAGPENVVYHQRLEARATQSYLNRLVALPMYQHMTIRNWNTTVKLLSLLG